MEKPNVLVTGGCGFLGTEIVSALLATNRFSITALDINPPSLGTSTFPQHVRYVRCNILDTASLKKVFEEAQPSIVVHAVGVYPLGTRRYSQHGRDVVFRVNVEGTRNVVEASKECGAKGLVFTSSVAVVLDDFRKDWKNADERWGPGEAQTTYGQSKGIAESIVLSANTHDFSTCALRCAPIFGPNHPSCIPAIHASIATYQTPFILGTGINMQDFVYVSNAADAHVLAVANLLNAQTAAGQAIFITNGEPVSMRDLCLGIWKEFGHVPKFQVTVPERLAWWVGVGAECVGWLTRTDLGFSRGLVSDGCRDRYVSISKARSVLRYKPRVGLAEGVKISCEHFQKRIDGRAKR